MSNEDVEIPLLFDSGGVFLWWLRGKGERKEAHKQFSEIHHCLILCLVSSESVHFFLLLKSFIYTLNNTF